MKIFGIDVSAWEKGFNFKKAKQEGVNFVILRGAYAQQKDKCYEKFYKQAKAQGLGVGVYVYSMAENTAEAKAEATKLYNNCLKGKKFEYPIYYDVEDKIQKKLGKTKMNAIIKTFCSELESKGYYVGVYTNLDFYKNYCSGSTLAKKYTWWLACWTKTMPKVTGAIDMWQFGGETNAIRTTKVAGMVCDQNYALVDFPKKIKEKGKNGYNNTPTPAKDNIVAGGTYKLLQAKALRTSPKLANNIVNAKYVDSATKKLLVKQTGNAMLKAGTEITCKKISKEKNGRTWGSYGNCWVCLKDASGHMNVKRV